MTRSKGRICFGRTVIGYVIFRKAGLRDIAITVRPDGQTSATAPRGTRTTDIAAAVRARAPWILEQTDRIARYAKPLPREFVSGESFLYLGRQYRLKVRRLHSRRDGELTFGRGTFTASVPASWGPRKRPREVRRLMVEWYRKHAYTKLSDLVVRNAKKLNIEPPTVRIHELKGRWASCGKGGVLRFNWRVIMAPLRVVEYVVAHELCHLRHPKHSPAFWRRLGKLIPDYQRRREDLNLTGPRYDF